MQERWYEKLHEWDKALSAYERQQEKNPDDTNFLYGRMRCLEALGEWCVFMGIILTVIVVEAVQHVHLTNIPVWFGLLGDI